VYSLSFEASFLVAGEDALRREGQAAQAPVRAVLVVRVDMVRKIVPRSKGRATSLKGAFEGGGVESPRAAGLPDLVRRDFALEGRNRRRDVERAIAGLRRDKRRRRSLHLHPLKRIQVRGCAKRWRSLGTPTPRRRAGCTTESLNWRKKFRRTTTRSDGVSSTKGNARIIELGVLEGG